MPKIWDVNTGVSDSGSGRAVVFLHGFLESKSVWNSIELPKSYRKISIDLLGHGDTQSKGYMHSMEDMAAHVSEVLRSLKVRRAVFVGHSMGGYVAAAMLKVNPDLVRGVCFFHSTAQADSGEKKKNRTRAIKIVKQDRNVFVNGAILNLFAPENQVRLESEIAALQKSASKTTVVTIVNALEGMKDRIDSRSLLVDNKVSVHYVIGAEDPVLPLTKMNAEVQEMQASKTVIQGCGHMGFLEAPLLASQGLRKWLRSLV